MRRVMNGTLVGWVVSGTCLLAQTPLPFGAMDGPPAMGPDRGSAGATYSPYGRYNQSSHFDAAGNDDARRQANYRSNTGVIPASSGPVLINGNNGPAIHNNQ